jgi:AcrR family transcriptional regulator
MRRRKQELYAERREQIINGALQVFSTKGFLAATNKAIAEAAEINSPGLIYHYFASKEDCCVPSSSTMPRRYSC